MSTTLFGLANYTAGGTADELAAKIQGRGITITNPVLRRGSINQTGIFTDGATGADLAIDEGIYLGGMSVQEAFTTNSSWQTSNNFFDITPDADLVAIDSRAIYDTVVFEFDVTLDSNTRLLLVNYQFASDEYNEYVGSIYNDAFGFFVSGGDLPAGTVYNIARVVDPQVFTDVTNLENFPPVTVNNVNNGSRGSYNTWQPADLTNSAYFIDNEDGKAVDVEFDGLTVGLNATLDNLTPGETYHFKMALADVGDSQWDTGVFVNSIQGVRGPQLCYDYAYEQNGRFFTEVYESTGPQLEGTVVTGTPINIRVSVQNQHEAEEDAENVKFSVLNMDPTQIEYEPETVYVTNPGDLAPVAVPDNSGGMSVSSSQILNIPVDNIKSLEEFFVYYSVNPITASLSTPLELKVEYDVTFALSSTQDLTVHLAGMLDEDTPICTGANFEYEPAWGVFNVEDHAISGTGQYNLYTQVAKRPFAVDLVAYDKNNPDVQQGVNSIAAIELIDAKPYHDVNASCQDPLSAITPRVWMIVGDGSALPSPITPIDISAAISSGMTEATSLDDFYGTARENTAFRISYNVTAGDGSLVKTTLVPGKNGKPDVYEIDNYTELVQDYGTCKVPVEKLTGTGTTVVTASVCGNSGTAGLEAWELARCNECLYGYNTVVTCSRDNFSIRPEAYKIDVYDNAQGTSETKNKIPTEGNIAAGYNYSYDFTATSHADELPVKGYTHNFGTPLPDHNISYVWNPVAAATACNDATNYYLTANIVNGEATDQLNSNGNVGDYILKMRDSEWTMVDQAPSHHSGSHFGLNDCTLNESFVPNNATVLNNTNIGCDISSEHTNSDISKEYVNYEMRVHPFRFALDLLSFYRGMTDKVVTDNSFVYMNSLLLDANMSARYDGYISAVGADDGALSNYVANCYAQPVDLDVETSSLPTTPIFRYRLYEYDTAEHIIRDTNATATGSALQLITVLATSFLGTSSGRADVTLHLNFDRFSNTPVNPVGVTYGDLNVSCTTAANCQSYANLSTTHEPVGTKEANATVVYLYGRANAPRRRVMCSSDTEACTGDMTFYYEFYADDTLTAQEKTWITSLIPADKIQRSLDSVNWYRNSEHNATDGGVTKTTQSNTGITPGSYVTVNGVTSSPFTYSGKRGFPYKNSVRVTSGDGIEPWLVYDPYVTTATTVSGDIEYYGPGKWTTTGDLDTHSEAETNKAKKTNRRIRW